METRLTKGINKGGFGRQGYCKLCSFSDPDDQRDFDKRVDKGWSPPKLNEWLEQQGLPTVNRQTVYSHRKHVAHPKDRMVSAVEKRQAEHGFMPAKVSHDEFTETIISLAQQRAIANPDEVSIADGLKAASIRANMSQKGQNLNLLVQLIGGAVPQENIIEGEVTEA